MSHKIILKDMIQDTILYQGEGNFEQNENEILIDFGQDTYHYRFNIKNNFCFMNNTSELDIHLPLDPNQETKGWIDTPFGRIDIKSKTTLWKQKKNSLEFAYHLSLQEEEQPFHFLLEFGEEE